MKHFFTALLLCVMAAGAQALPSHYYGELANNGT